MCVLFLHMYSSKALYWKYNNDLSTCWGVRVKQQLCVTSQRNTKHQKKLTEDTSTNFSLMILQRKRVSAQSYSSDFKINQISAVELSQHKHIYSFSLFINQKSHFYNKTTVNQKRIVYQVEMRRRHLCRVWVVCDHVSEVEVQQICTAAHTHDSVLQMTGASPWRLQSWHELWVLNNITSQHHQHCPLQHLHTD